MTREREQYTMGYGPAATTIMAQRTAQNHAAFLLPHLKPGMNLLDCGCGPGTISAGFAEIVAPGEVTGTEIEESQVALGRQNAAARNITNVRFEVGSIYELPFPDGTFDALFMSAILGNLREPLQAVREAHRVLKTGGVIGVKEFDHGGDIVYPRIHGVEKFTELYLQLRSGNGHDPEGGRKIGSYLLAAGFSDLNLSACYESLSGPETVSGAAKINMGLLKEGWAEVFIDRGWATAESIAEMSEAWRQLGQTPGAMIATTWCEAVAWKL